MQDGLTRLASARDLVERLPFSAVTVVLLTAAWSFESNTAREALEQARRLVQCGPLSVSYYELPVPISQLHPQSVANVPRPLAAFFSADFQRTTAAARNVTAALPWFPCLRLFHGGDDAVDPITHVDSFAPAEIAGLIELQCRLCERNLQENVGEGGICDGAACSALADSPLVRLKRFITPISRDRFGSEMRQSIFRPRGAIFMVQGGIAEVLATHLEEWDAVGEAISSTNDRKTETQYNRKQWVVSIADTTLDRELAERNGLDMQGGPALLLVDSLQNSYELYYIHSNATMTYVSHLLQNFENVLGSSKGTSSDQLRNWDMSHGNPLHIRERILAFWRKPLAWRKFFSTQCEICLKNFVNRRFDTVCQAHSWVWLVVHQPWCGFSQRIVGCYRRLESVFREHGLDAYVVEVTDIREIPLFLDEMVDGFPTVIRLRSGENEETVDEYEGKHDVEEILRSMLFEDVEIVEQAIVKNRSCLT